MFDGFPFEQSIRKIQRLRQILVDLGKFVGVVYDLPGTCFADWFVVSPAEAYVRFVEEVAFIVLEFALAAGNIREKAKKKLALSEGLILRPFRSERLCFQ